MGTHICFEKFEYNSEKNNMDLRYGPWLRKLKKSCLV